MTALTDDGNFAARTTEHSGYPLPEPIRPFEPRFNGWRQYLLPSPTTGRPTGFTRATTVAGTLDDTYGLSRWARRETCKRLVEVFDRSGGDTAAATTLADIVSVINTAEKVSQIDQALDALDDANGGADARELGQSVHEWLGALDAGTVTYSELPAMILPYADAYLATLARHGLEPVPGYIERIVLNDRGEETVVGTLDRVFRVVSTGELVLGDLKTSKSLDFSELSFAVQLAVYGYATRMLSEDGKTWEPMPELNQTYAIIMHVPSNQPERTSAVTSDLWFGGEALIESLACRARRKAAKKRVFHVHAIPAPTDAALRHAAARERLLKASHPSDLSAVWEEYQDIWTDDLTAFGNLVAERL